MSDDFQVAAGRARDRYAEQIWNAMSFREQTIAIYEELRALDAERIAGQSPPGCTPTGGEGSSG
jgi:hypothetical protein